MGTVAAKTACIGAGYWGKNLVRDFNDLTVLCWVCDVDLERRTHLATAYPEVKFADTVAAYRTVGWKES